MARLTEEMVVARSRQSDLGSVKKLNCWGAELGDVSLLRRMPNVEVLALSVNSIATLADFAYCPRLRELYLRRNHVRELTEIRHLRCLPRLTSLWLEENPCTDHPNYRLTVLRNLPNLQKLDNVVVQTEELEEAMRKGTPIADPDEEFYQTEEEEYRAQLGRPQRSAESSPERPTERAPPHEYRREQGSDCSEGAGDSYPEPEPAGNGRRKSPPSAQVSPTRTCSPEPEEQRYEHPAASRPHRYYDSDEKLTRLRQANSGDSPAPPAPAAVRHSRSAHSVKDYASTNGDSHRPPTSPPHASRHSADLQHYRDTYPERPERSESYHTVPQRCPLECDRDGSRESLGRRERDGDIASAVMAEHRGFMRRPVTRNSNLLSAVLCLVKELDYPSLEVVEMAVRCRMDELANMP